MFVKRGSVVRLNDVDGRIVSETNVGSPSGVPSGDSDEKAKTATSAAAASRENFLRRLELQQQQQPENPSDVQSIGDIETESKSSAAARDAAPLVPTVKETNLTTVTALKSDVSREEAASSLLKSPPESVMAASAKEALTQLKSDIPRGNQNEDLTNVMSYLSTQSNLTSDLSSLDWIRDVDESSLMFLKGLASSDRVGIGGTEALAVNLKVPSETVSLQQTSRCPTRGALLPVPEKGTYAQAALIRESEDVIEERKIAKATTPTNNNDHIQSAPTTTVTDQSSSIELRMLSMIETQQNQMTEMRDRLLAMEEMMARMSGDIAYLRESQQRRDQIEGRFVGNMLDPRMHFQIPMGSPTGGRGEVGRFPPPPPPPPPQAGQSTVATAVHETAPNMNRPLVRDVNQPFHRGIFFPLATYLFRCIKSFITSFRSALLSTGPGRVYAHLRNEAVRRRAFANVDLMALMKLVVMLLVFSGRMGRNDDRIRERRGARRVQENNNEGGDDGISVASIIQTAMTFLRSHRVHVLVIASMIGFMVQTGLMAFFYEVFWVEREELLHVWLGQRIGADDNEADENVQAGEHQQNDNAQPAAGAGNQQAPAGQARAGALPNPVQRGRNAQNREANANRRAGGMIRRGPNGGFFHDVQCLILSFVLSLIPAWKPEEAAAPQQREQAQAENPQQDGDAGNAGHGEIFH